MSALKFEFASASKIIFGNKSITQLGAIAASLGKKVFIVTGSDEKRYAKITAGLDVQKLPYVLFPVTGEPTLDIIRNGIREARFSECDLVVGIGGGSAIDTGKAVSAMLSNPGDPLDYLEIIGQGKSLQHQAIAFIAVPTTAGTGAEVTKNAVISSPQHRVKASLRSNLMLPRVALIDPELTYALPSDITATTGLDALTQLIEPFVSIKANPFTDVFCRDGIQRAVRSLMRACIDGNDVAARCDMSMASLFGGLALANGGLGAVHGLAGPIGGMFPAPHGAICARLLPEVLMINFRALSLRAPQSPHISRFVETAHMLTGNQSSTVQDAYLWLRDLCDSLHIHSLSVYGLTPGDFEVLIEKSKTSGSMRGNPITLNDEEIIEILSLSI